MDREKLYTFQAIVIRSSIFFFLRFYKFEVHICAK